MVTTSLISIWAASAVLLVITVLLHSPKGDGMGGLATGAGGSMFTSARSAENTLNKVTWTLVMIFMVLAVVLSAGWLG
ncbi:MAG: preprotein translocase subunit SecG [Aphanocapsa feldmannii 277cV]|uniref:Protein-export membrane protein SecG n=1 Tax=Aphanocapsa feldmannii 277cV TaxID=2507553 RepID=A0A524RP23_9CHRO|nr:MAG: preprotein translocase subunit SecG [Aphanocapsa feldmannii 288cV]TGG93105.1 MAG: preprotein translocase subunit SecG [Aphanocapsa feldmannii 277cV]